MGEIIYAYFNSTFLQTGNYTLIIGGNCSEKIQKFYKKKKNIDKYYEGQLMKGFKEPFLKCCNKILNNTNDMKVSQFHYLYLK